MRAKRQRASEDVGEDGLPLDPSTMTERQQLAFLLRKTAQEQEQEQEHEHERDHDHASSADTAPSSETSDDDRRLRKRTSR